MNWKKLLLAWVLFTFGCDLGPARGWAEEPTRLPNVILILMDDMGWRDVGFAGNLFVETPNLDKLAKNGLVFSQAYASAPNCSPTRACLMSGQYTPRHGVYTVIDPNQVGQAPWQKWLAAENREELAPQVTTVAETLQSAGYRTAFFGMWNLGRGRKGPATPSGQGFEQAVFPENLGFAKDAYLDKHGNYLSDRLMDEAIQFVEQHRHHPFFIYFADHAVHAPYDPKPELEKKYAVKARLSNDRRDDAAYAATIESVDQNVGRLVDVLQRLDLLEDTVVIFTSDNGGTPAFTAPLRGSKGQLYEGGIRVPLAIHYPRKLGSAGRISNIPVNSVDIYPTLIELAEVSPPRQTLDGISLLPLFSGTETLERSQMFWHFPCYVGRATPASAIREGDWKLIEFFEDDGRCELFNLKDDPAEQQDLSKSRPELAARLRTSLKHWQAQTGAAIPDQPNPHFDPQARRPQGRGNRQQK